MGDRSCDLPAAVARLQVALQERLGSFDGPASRGDLLTHAMQRFDDGIARVADVADELGVSDRHFRRVFQDDLGMTPKHYGRLSRLRRALARDGSRESWARVALEAGFHDQSHLIREFRDLLQETPEAFRRNAELAPRE